jgi:hypothetical protein
VNPSGSTAWEFAIRSQKQFLIRQVQVRRVKIFAPHTFIPQLHLPSARTRRASERVNDIDTAPKDMPSTAAISR